MTRRLLVIAVEGGQDSTHTFTTGIEQQIAVVTSWLADPALGEDRRFEVITPPALETVDELRAFLLEKQLSAATHDEAFVVYITGHGLRSSTQRHYLKFPDTDEDRLIATGFPTAELIAPLLDSHAEHILVMVDSCFAGALNSEIAALAGDLAPHRADLATVAVVTSGASHQQPEVGEFCKVISLALDKIRDESAGFTRSHLTIPEWRDVLCQVSTDNPHLLQARWTLPRTHSAVPSACLPNPRYQPVRHVVGPALRQVSVEGEALNRYWLARASGRTTDDDTGWYFSGRREPLRAMAAFLEKGSGVLVVTGAAGSGKSALLAQLVTLTDATFLADPHYAAIAHSLDPVLLPPAGSVRAAAVARNKTSSQLVEDLLHILGADIEAPAPSQTLLDHVTALAAPGQPVTIVIDALDEADEPLACVNDVVLPLARLRDNDGDGELCARLVLGIRSSPTTPGTHLLQDQAADHLLAALETVLAQDRVEHDTMITHGDDCTGDIAAYVSAVLQQPTTSPYHQQPDDADAAAAVIADAVTPSFLDARLAAAQLRTAPTVQDLGEPGWRASLSQGTTALLAKDIHDVARHHDLDPAILLAVLRATALAQGNGLPWDRIWPAVTAALLDDVTTTPADHAELDHVIRLVRTGRLVGYLAADHEDDRVTYRPVHQRVAEKLRDEPAELLTPAEATSATEASETEVRGVLRPSRDAHAAITGALTAHITATPHLQPHPYALRHLLAHAAAGNVLDDAHVPAELLAQETSHTLRAALGLPLPTHDRKRRLLTAAATVEPYLDPTVTATDRLDSIAFHLRAHDPHAPTPPTNWSTRWAEWQPATNVLAAPPGAGRALCTLESADGRTLIAATSTHGAAVWDATTGRQLATLDTGPLGDLCPIRTHSGRTMLATAGLHGAAIWDPYSGQCLAHADLPHAWTIAPVDQGELRWRLVVETRDGAFQWLPDARTAPPRPLPWPVPPRRHPNQIRTPIRVHGDSAVAAVDTPDGVRFWSLSTDRFLDPPLAAGRERMRAMTVLATPDGPDLLVTSREREHQANVWDPSTGQLVHRIRGAARQLIHLPSPTGLLLAVLHQRQVEVWELSGTVPELAGRVVAGSIRTIAAMPPGDGRWRLATAGPEGVRLWSSADDTRPTPSKRKKAPGSSSSVCAVPYGASWRQDVHQDLALTARSGLHMIDPDNGNVLRRFSRLPASTTVRPIPSPDLQPLVLLTDSDSHTIWNLWAETPVSDRFVREPGAPACGLLLPDGGSGFVQVGRQQVTVHRAGGTTRSYALSLRPRTATDVVALPPRVHDDGTPSEGPWPGRVVMGHGWELRTWDLEEALVTATSASPARLILRHLCPLPSADGPYLLASADSRGIHLFDTTGLGLARTIKIPATTCLASIPLPDGSFLLASGHGHGIRVWNPDTGTLLNTLITSAPVRDLTVVQRFGETLLCTSGPDGMASFVLPYPHREDEPPRKRPYDPHSWTQSPLQLI